ncbi:hypothetical protein QTP70_014651 [Hemibagrus guttatus]|uniref:C-type lectin domain-containing protein n=1 Tax=Hemibagrus guttatus TaxID=175788 RepID=A0AAE0QN77_9TELE|nr:hypothetical protein QTP70_014651 [Hemibagrus guttatus]
MLSLFVSVLVLFFGEVAGLTREYIPGKTSMNWSDAQQYCRRYYRDLATVTTAEENQRLYALMGNIVSAWIGMYRGKKYVNIWLWSDQAPSSFFQWNIYQPSNNMGNQDCVEMEPGGWNDQFCSANRIFVCYQFIVLVKEKKTWEEAYEYCRMNYTGLVSAASETKLQLAEMESGQTQTDSIWTGLRFLNGEWLWVCNLEQQEKRQGKVNVEELMAK